MTTQATQQPNRKGPAEQVVFIEYSTAQKGQHFMTVMGKENGRRKIVARIFREYDSVLKQMKYTAKDREGKEIFPEIVSLYDLKKKFVENAKQISQEVSATERNEPTRSAIVPEQQTQEKGEKKSIGKQIKDKAQELTHSLVPDKEAESLNPEADKVMEGMKREDELKEVRSGKDKGKELTR